MPAHLAAAHPLDLAPYTAPVSPFRAVALARIPVRDWLPGHRGIDLHAAAGDTVVAPARGVVSFAGVVVDRAVLTITHDDGRLSSFEPVDALVEVGSRVAAGEPVGTVAPGSAHCETACVHWGVRQDGRYLDPLDLVEGFGPVRLLPADRGAFVS
ncbi:M23 family metallopeptidase [Demequina sp. NBRC 110053]|uniref:M23 family metallopeptidase n=1 Tax=Demequina sp. NBRC 110053 TaxID=1570342 RepID=UPI001F33D1BF|nr:M23 family metallopeptidase [Demequina sp. NBRC 110053]